jgi:ATP-binding cassette subfamily C exporter for protease/lipase
MRAALDLCRRHFIAAAGFSALVNLLYIAPTIYMLQVYDRVVPTQGHLTLFFLTLVLLFALGTLALLDRVRSRLLVRASVATDAALAPAILDATLGRPDLAVSRQALREFDMMRQTLTGPGILALFDAPWAPIYILACFLIHPFLGVVAIVGCVLLPFIAWRNEKATRPRLDRSQAAAGAAYAGQESLLGAAETVRALGMRRAVVARQLRQRQGMMTTIVEASFTASGYQAATRFARLALQSLALGVGALLAIDNKISGGAIFAASFLISRALAPIEQLIGSWKPIVQARNSYKALDDLLGRGELAPDRTLLPAPKGALLLDQLVIFNETRDGTVLGGIGCTIAAGEAVAIVGPSGAGKSTLVRAIAGAILPDRGTIRIDGADARDWDPERLARHIGYLPQDPGLLAGTVKENICRFATELGEDAATVDAAVVAAAQKVGAHDLILQLSNGYEHRLMPGGRGLSAGQAQRIALARAVYGDPALYILDEPNAHLDSEGDAQLVAALGRLKAEGKTILIVSHKLGILPIIDRIMVLRGGRIEMFGPRDEVLPKIAPANIRPIAAAQGTGGRA